MHFHTSIDKLASDAPYEAPSQLPPPPSDGVQTTDSIPFIDSKGCLKATIDQRLPTILPPAVVADVKKFLLNTLPNASHFRTIAELLYAEKECAAKGEPIEEFRIVGSIVPYLLQTMLPNLFAERLSAYQGVAEQLCSGECWQNLSREPRDWDIRSYTPTATIKSLNIRLNQVTGQQLTLDARGQNPAPFNKCRLAKDGDYILVGSSLLDYCLGIKFKRSHLFENSNLQIVIEAASLTKDASKIKIFLFSQDEQGLQALTDRAFKYLRVRNPQTVNYCGATAWVSAIVAGYMPVDAHHYRILLNTLLTKHEPRGEWGERIARLITHTIAAHHTPDALVKVALTLQFELNNALWHDENFAPSYQEFLGKDLWRELIGACLPHEKAVALQEPLVALRVNHGLSGLELIALLQLGALLTLSLSSSYGDSTYQIEHLSVDGQPATRYTLAPGSYLLVPLDIDSLIKTLEQPSFCAKLDCPALFDFLTKCYNPALMLDQVAPTPESQNDVLIKSLAPQKIMACAEKCRSYGDPVAHLISTILLTTLTTCGSSAAEESLLTQQLPQLLNGKTLLSPWINAIANALLCRVATKSQYPAIQGALAETAKGALAAPIAWWQALAATHYPLYCSWATGQALLITARASAATCTLAKALDCSACIWLAKIIYHYSKDHVPLLLPLWQNTLKTVSTSYIDATSAQKLLYCCRQLAHACKDEKTRTGFALALFHTLTINHPAIALELAEELLPANYPAQQRLRWVYTTQDALRTAEEAAAKNDFASAMASFKKVWQQLHGAQRSVLPTKRRWRRVALAWLRCMPHKTGLEAGAEVLLAPYGRALLGKTRWELYLNRWLQGCRAHADAALFLTDKAVKELIAHLILKRKPQRLALCKILSWLAESNAQLTLKHAEGVKLIQTCASMHSSSCTWLAAIAALEQLQARGLCPTAFQRPPPKAYSHILLALWQYTQDQERLIHWLDTLPTEIDDALAERLLAIAPHIRLKESSKATWSYLQALKPHLTTEHLKTWEKLAYVLAKELLIQKDHLLVAQIILACSLPIAHFSAALPDFCQILLRNRAQNHLLLPLIRHFATSLGEREWNELWSVLKNGALLTELEEVYHLYNHYLIAQDQTAQAPCLMALIHAGSSKCLFALNPPSKLVSLVESLTKGPLQHATLYCQLLEITLNNAHFVPAATAQTLYQLLSNLPLNAKKQLTLKLKCLQLACAATAWPLATFILDTLLAIAVDVSSLQLIQASLEKLLICPMDDPATIQVLLKVLLQVQQAKLITTEEQAKVIYSWLMALPPNSFTDDETSQYVCDRLALETLLILVNALEGNVSAFITPATQQLLKRRTQLIADDEQLQQILFLSQFIQLIDRKIFHELMHCYMINVFNAAIAADDYHPRLQAMEVHLQCSPNFPCKSPSEEYTKLVTTTLIDLLIRDQRCEDFRRFHTRFFQQIFNEVWLKTTTVPTDVCKASFNYCCQLLKATRFVNSLDNHRVQKQQIIYLSELLTFMLDCYQADKFPRPTSQELFDQIILYALAGAEVYQENLESYIKRYKQLQLLIQKSDLLSDFHLQAFFFYVAKAKEHQSGLTKEQLNETVYFLLTYPADMPSRYGIVMNAIENFKALKNDFTQQHKNYQLRLEQIHCLPSKDSFQKLEEYEAFASLLLTTEGVFGKGCRGNEAQLVLEFYIGYLEKYQLAAFEYWQMIDASAVTSVSFNTEEQRTYLPFLLLQKFIKQGIFQQVTTISQDKLWEMYSMLILRSLEHLQLTFKRKIWLADTAEFRKFTLEEQIAILYELIAYMHFNTNKQPLDYQKTLFSQVIAKLSQDANFTPYITYFLALALRGGKLFVNDKTFGAMLPSQYQTYIAKAQQEALRSIDHTGVVLDKLQRILKISDLNALLAEMNNIHSYALYLETYELSQLIVKILIRLYVEYKAKDAMQAYLNYFISLCPNYVPTTNAPKTLNSTEKFSELAISYWHSQPRFALQLLLFNNLITADFNGIEQCKTALALTCGLVKKLVKIYSSEKEHLVKVICTLLISPLAKAQKFTPNQAECIQGCITDIFSMLIPTTSWQDIRLNIILITNYVRPAIAADPSRSADLFIRLVDQCAQLWHFEDTTREFPRCLFELSTILYTVLPARDRNGTLSIYCNPRLFDLATSTLILLYINEIILSCLEKKPVDTWMQNGHILIPIATVYTTNSSALKDQMVDSKDRATYERQSQRFSRFNKPGLQEAILEYLWPKSQ